MAQFDSTQLFVLALIFVGVWAGLDATLFFARIPAANVQMVQNALSGAGNLSLIVAGYFFGSSQGSRSKDASIAGSAPVPSSAALADLADTLRPDVPSSLPSGDDHA
jgi:hypothetical protein